MKRSMLYLIVTAIDEFANYFPFFLAMEKTTKMQRRSEEIQSCKQESVRSVCEFF